MSELMYPRCGFISNKKRQERVLLLCCFHRYGVPSVVEIVEFVQRLSMFPVTVLNLYEHRTGDSVLTLPPGYDITAFSCVVIHNTVSYNPDNLFSLDRYLSPKFSDYDGVKILFKQDDHYRFRETSEFVRHAKIDVVFTITPQEEVSKVYREEWIGKKVEICHMLTGYVSPQMRVHEFPKERGIDIGYRGSVMPLSFGRLCFEKRKIGDDVSELLRSRHDLVIDISSRWEDRLGGTRWFQFLRNCKSVLGVESGSGIFDLDGSLKDRCEEIERDLGPFRLDHEYAELYLSRLADYEGNVKYFMISPRHFEAIANGAAQILFQGRYTDRLLADRHYFSLRRDYGNLDEILDQVSDPAVRLDFVERAFDEVILDERNWIETFIFELDSVIARKIEDKGLARSGRFASHSDRTEVKSVVLIQAHEFGSDPRRDCWIPENCGPGLLVHQVVIDRTLVKASVSVGKGGGSIYSLPYRRWTRESLNGLSVEIGQTDPLIGILTQLKYVSGFEDREFAEFYGASINSPRLAPFRWYLDYLLNTTSVLVDAFRGIRGYGAIIAVNLPTLLAAAIVKRLNGIPIVYEALEYWPEADPDSEQFEIDFWLELENRLVSYVDSAGTVSPGLAKLMGSKYGRTFRYLPNCCPIGEGVVGARRVNDGSVVNFLYQGTFAPHRGLEELISAFSSERISAHLLLRGSNNTYREGLVSIARKRAVLNTKVFFLAPVKSGDLVSAAAEAGDIGVIPYAPIGENYKNCSPNKLGQFMAAGLPLLANKTDFVEDVIRNSKCGLVVDFSNTDLLIRAIVDLSTSETLRQKFSRNSRDYFESYFNWEHLSVDFYDEVSLLSEKAGGHIYTIYDVDNKKLFLEASRQNIQKRRVFRISFRLLYGLWCRSPRWVRRILEPLKSWFVRWVSRKQLL